MSLQPPIVCLVTDRRRLAGRLRLDPDGRETLDALVGQIEEAARAGAGLVQIRERDLAAGALVTLVRRAVAACRTSATTVVVNDRLDVALAAGAAGVHLPEDSLPPERVRDLASDLIVGRSLHAIADVAVARSVAYVVFGSIFPTRSKPAGHPVAGLEHLAAAVRTTGLPVIAIGGVDLENVCQVAAAGASGIAAVDLFLPPRPGMSPGWLREAVSRVRDAFDMR